MPEKKKKKKKPMSEEDAIEQVRLHRLEKRMMDDAQKRAQAFNDQQRIAELEAELARLRAALRQIMDLDPDQRYSDFVRESGRIAMLALGSDPKADR